MSAANAAPAAAPAAGPGRNARWRVEWRVPTDGDGPLLLVAREVRGAVAARRLAIEVGERAWAGEFRLSTRGVPAVVTDLVRLRRWEAASGPPPPSRGALWALELRDGRAAREFTYAVRVAVDRAAAAGVLAMADGLALVRVASTLTAC